VPSVRRGDIVCRVDDKSFEWHLFDALFFNRYGGILEMMRTSHENLVKPDDCNNNMLTPGCWKSERKFVEDTTCPE